MIKELEGEEAIEERFIDPRMGASQAAGKFGGTSYIDLLADVFTTTTTKKWLDLERMISIRIFWIKVNRKRR